MSNPLVTVVSVFYNRAAEIEVSVRSLLEQTYAPLEIIIVDDGSKDDTAERLRTFNDPRLSIRIQENQGFTRTIDAAVKSARGEFIAIHGSGDISLPDRIERQAQVLRDNPEVGVVGCFIQNDNGRTIPLRSQAAPDQPLSYHELLKIYPISHGEAMFRKSSFMEVGGYRAFFAFAQDHDLWLRINRVAKFWTVPELLYVRRRFDNAVSADPVKMVLQGFNAEFAQQMERSWMPGKGDLLDQYGPAAVFLRGKSEQLAKRLNLIAMAQLAEGDEAKGRLIMQANRAQSSALATRLLGMMADMSRDNPQLWRSVFKPLLRRVSARRSAKVAAANAEKAPDAVKPAQIAPPQSA